MDAMMEDPLKIVVTAPVKEITHREAPDDTPMTVDPDAEEANVTSTENKESELFSRGGSVPLAVEDVEEEVQEVEAPAKTPG